MKKIVLFFIFVLGSSLTNAQTIKEFCKEHEIFQHLDASV